MPERASQIPEIKVHELKGLNIRAAEHAIPSGQATVLQGMYPARTGLLQRVPGKLIYRFLQGRSIDSMHQAFDGTGNAFVQNGDRLDVYTLDEFLNRATTPTLTRNPITPEEDMSYAILTHQDTVSNPGGALGASDNTFYTTTINTLTLDDDSIIVSLGSNQFTLAPGTYRIRARIAWGAAGAAASGATAYLYNVTSGAIQENQGTSNDILSTADKEGTTNSNGWLYLAGEFEFAGSNNTFEIRMAMSDNASETFAQGRQSTVTSGSHPQIYKVIEIWQVA